MNVTILGATGSMGREITSQLIRSRALSRREILQLASNPFRPASRWCAEGIRRDLQDAYAEINPEIQVVEDPDEVIGDVVVVAAGATVTPGNFAQERRDLELNARAMCDCYAARLAETLTKNQVQPVFLIVSNPVEYVVQRFAQELSSRVEDGSRLVIGMGAHSDSLRFQWEIARDLGVVRDRVSAEVVGEHGPGMVPRWSTVQIRGMPEREQERCLRRLYERDREANAQDFDALLGRRRREIVDLLAERESDVGSERRADLLRVIESYRPDFRVNLKPHVVHHSKSKTAHATGVAATQLLEAILKGQPLVPTVQRMVPPAGDPASPHFPFGVPTPLAEIFRGSGWKLGNPWAWRKVPFAPGTFRAERDREEQTRIDQGIATLRARSEAWCQTLTQ